MFFGHPNRSITSSAFGSAASLLAVVKAIRNGSRTAFTNIQNGTLMIKDTAPSTTTAKTRRLPYIEQHQLSQREQDDDAHLAHRRRNGRHHAQRREHRVVGVDAFRAHDMGPDGLNNWVERHHAGADPIRQCRDIDLDPFAGIGLALAVQRLMQQELVDQHHRQQARSGKASRDRMRGRRRLGDRLAVPAGELFADVLDDLPAPRLAFQGLRYHLAKLVQPLTAALAAGARRGFDDTFDRQVDLAGDVEAAADFAHASAWRLLVLRSRPWFPARPGSLQDPRWPAQAARPAACRVQRIARTARAVPWPASASAVRFPGGRRSLRSSPASAVRAAQGSSRAQRQGRREADRRASSR